MNSQPPVPASARECLVRWEEPFLAIDEPKTIEAIARLIAAREKPLVDALLSIGDGRDSPHPYEAIAYRALNAHGALPTPMVTVCDKCKRASCWQGVFYCDEARSAGTVDLPVSELRLMGLESPVYWKVSI